MARKKQEDIGYAAGFFDADGYFGIGYGGRLEIRITNTNKNVIHYLHSLWGGTIHERKRVSGKQVYDLVIVSKKDVNNFIDTVYSFLKVKKERVDKFLKIKELVEKIKTQ